MKLSDKEIKVVIDFVKMQPRTMQEISHLIKKSWVTTDSYVQQIREHTGLVGIKTFRKGTQAALKIVYYEHKDSLMSDGYREMVTLKISSARYKQDFDFMDVYQFVPGKLKRAFSETATKDSLVDVSKMLQSAERQVYCFSGNLSFASYMKNLTAIEDLLKRNVMVKIVCRVNQASISNISRFSAMMVRYPGFIEIRHCYQPLRGFIIDDTAAYFKSEERQEAYKLGELDTDTRVRYEIYDPEWVSWLQKLFWGLFRSSIDCTVRLKEMQRIKQPIPVLQKKRSKR